MNTIPFCPHIASELAEREAALEATRTERIAGAQALIQRALSPTVEREVTVLLPHTTFEGHTRYHRVRRTRTLPVILR